MSKKENSNQVKKKRSKTPLSALIIMLLALLGGGTGFAYLNGNLDIDKITKKEDTKKEAKEVSKDATEKATKKGEVIVTIDNKKVTIGDKEIKNSEELKKYLDANSDDGVTYTLVDKDSIQETYEWVVDTFKTLNIKLNGEK